MSVNEERLARQVAAEAAIARIEQMVDEVRDDPARYEARLAAAQQIIPSYRQRIVGEADDTKPGDMQNALEAMIDAALDAERGALLKLLKARKINDDTMRAVMGEVTLGQALSARKRAAPAKSNKRPKKAGARK